MRKSLIKISKELSGGSFSPISLVKEYIQKIEQNNSKINAFIRTNFDTALEKAEISQERHKKGSPKSAFDGIPIGIKDNIAVENSITSCGSQFLSNYVSPYSATVIHKLEEKGFIPISGLNMDEFAMGSSTEYSSYGCTKNPYDTKCVPGGSSGGSAAAVAMDFVPVSLGSDTGGSIRQPASFCGVVGLKPTYGTVSRYGLVAFGSSLDQIGPIGYHVEDVESIYKIILGFDEKDATSIPNSQYSIAQEKPLESIKVGICPSLLDFCSDAVKSSFQKTMEYLQESFVHKKNIIPISLEYQKYEIPTYYIVASSEASSNLSRFDGVRYGKRAKNTQNFQEIYFHSRTQNFGAEVKRRILTGTYALSSGYYEDYYLQALKLRRLIQQSYLNHLKTVDIIITPTTPDVPFPIGTYEKNAIQMYFSDVLTVGASLAGLPAISLPSAFESLPVGIQITGNFFSENILFQMAKAIQKQFPAPLPQ